jgi:hypothetical protein
MLPEPQIALRSRHPLDPRRILTLKLLKQPARDITPIDHPPIRDRRDHRHAEVVGVIGALLKLLRELRRALIKLVIDDPEHSEPHRRVTARIKTLAISAHHAGPYRRARGGHVATCPANFD